MKSRKFCNECKNLPEGVVVKGHDHRNDYHVFVKQGRAYGFTDDQIDFLADWIGISDGSVHTVCSNCSHQYDINLNKGQYPEKIEDQVCDYCRCKTLEVKM